MTSKMRGFGCGLIHWTFFRGEWTENVLSLKPIASNQWEQCIKSAKEHMKPAVCRGGKEGERVSSALNMRQGNQLKNKTDFSDYTIVVIMFHSWTTLGTTLC